MARQGRARQGKGAKHIGDEMSKAYFGGLPTAIDVRKLSDSFGEPDVGRTITHEEIEAALGIEHASNRYRTVVLSWRRKLLSESNIELGAVPGVGFKVLAADERISGSISSFQCGTRKQMRSVRRAMLVRTDDEILRRKQDVMQRTGSAIAAQASVLMKSIEPPKPTSALPKPARTE
jgi:hypothetical protein